MRHRIEDLGRIAEKLHSLTSHSIFSVITGRRKDFTDDFYQYTQEKQDEILHAIAYGLEYIEDELYACLLIAQGQDELNWKGDSCLE